MNTDKRLQWIRSERLFWLFYLIISLLGVLGSIYITVPLQAVIFLLVTIIAMSRAERYGILHPISWFSPFMLLYSISYPLFIWTSGGTSSQLDIVIPLCMATYVGFIMPIAFLSPFRILVPAITIDPKIIRKLIFISIVLCILLVLYVIVLGVASKREFIDITRASGVGSAFLAFTLLSVFYAVYLLIKVQRIARGVRSRLGDAVVLGVAVFAILLIGYGATGERDYMFRSILLVMLILFSVKYHAKFRYYYLLGSVFILILVLPATQSAKAFLISSSVSGAVFEVENIWKTEFASAGRNLLYLMERGVNDYHGETFIWDVKRALNFIFPDQLSTGMWFNQTLRTFFGDEGTSGWGFSLVAEGYINFGLIGPPILFLFLGLLSSGMYSHAARSQLKFIFYLCSIPVIIYVLRADLANYISLIFKINGFIVLVFYIASKFGSQSSRIGK